MSDVLIVKTKQWRYAQLICFKPKNQAQKDFLDGMPARGRSKKLNQVLTLFFATHKASECNKIKPVYYKSNAIGFSSITFQPNPTNAKIIKPMRSERGKVSVIMQKALDFIIKSNEAQK